MRKTAIVAALFFGMMLLTGCAASGNNGMIADGDTPETEEITFSPANAFADVVCSAEEALKWAEEKPVAVSGEFSTGQDIMASFFNTANAGNPASVLCAKYYELHPEGMTAELYEAEKDQYPVLYFVLVEYDGKEYHVKTRESSGTELDSAGIYQHLVFLTGENPEGALTKYTDEYVLVDDPDITLEQLHRSMVSSQYGDWIRHSTVFTDFHD